MWACVLQSLGNFEKWSKITKFAFYTEQLGLVVSSTKTRNIEVEELGVGEVKR